MPTGETYMCVHGFTRKRFVKTLTGACYDLPIQPHNGRLHHVPSRPDDVPGCVRPTPREDWKQLNVLFVHGPVPKVHD